MPPPPVSRVNVSLAGSQADAAAAGFNLGGATNVAQVHAAAAGRNLHLAVALVQFNAAAASLNDCALRSGLNLDAASAGLRDHFAVGVTNFDGAAAGVQSEVAAHRAHVDRSAAGFDAGAAANVIEAHAAAAALRLDASRQTPVASTLPPSVSSFTSAISRGTMTENCPEKCRGCFPPCQSPTIQAVSPFTYAVTLYCSNWRRASCSEEVL